MKFMNFVSGALIGMVMAYGPTAFGALDHVRLKVELPRSLSDSKVTNVSVKPAIDFDIEDLQAFIIDYRLKLAQNRMDLDVAVPHQVTTSFYSGDGPAPTWTANLVPRENQIRLNTIAQALNALADDSLLLLQIDARKKEFGASRVSADGQLWSFDAKAARQALGVDLLDQLMTPNSTFFREALNEFLFRRTGQRRLGHVYSQDFLIEVTTANSHGELKQDLALHVPQVKRVSKANLLNPRSVEAAINPADSFWAIKINATRSNSKSPEAWELAALARGTTVLQCSGLFR